MENIDTAQAILRERIETAIGRKMTARKDFDYLAERIHEKTHEQISISTLKRFWGYVSTNNVTRESTLDVLAHFIDYESYQAFCQEVLSSEQQTETPPVEQKSRKGKPLVWLALAVLVLGILLLFNHYRQTDKSFASARPVLKMGQTFASYDEFLSLFNIHATDNRYYQPVPECSIAYVWAPQYQHPTYHNEGNPDSLMPTIAEYLSLKPLDDSPESRQFLSEERRKGYLITIRNNQVRLVFMKNLPGDTCFTFTGIYRVSFTLSDTTKIIWTRVSQECDLNQLEGLDRFRN